MTQANQQEQKKTTPEEELVLLLERAKKGDPTVLPALRRLLDDSPALWQNYGNLALQAQASLVKSTAGNNLLMSESLMRKIASLTAEIAGVSPSPLERLLAERVVVCWLQVNYYDSLVAQVTKCSLAQGRMMLKQQDSAQHRYLDALKALATTRKLLTSPRSPLDIATRLEGERSWLRLREAPVEAGVPVAN